jgi:dolichyl-phosphate beta-glucosyltransferase
VPRTLSIVIPAYNEESRLPTTLQCIVDFLCRKDMESADILVVDDGSRDGTAAVAGRFPSVRVLRSPGNRGKGCAVRLGMLASDSEWTLFTDADLSTPIEELEKLWRVARESGADVVIGSRAMDRSLVGVHQSFLRESMGRIFNLTMRSITSLPFHDTQCGFKLFRTKAAHAIFRRQRLDGFGFDVEVLFIARILGFRAVEVPVRWNNSAATKVSLFGGFQAFIDPLRVRWNQWVGKYR